VPGVRFPSALLAVVAALASTLVLAAPAAAESVGEKIVEKCGHHEPLGGYTQRQYEEALKDMSTATREYSSCESEIRQAELAAAGGGTGAEGGGATSAPLALTPTEQRAVQSAHKHGARPVQVGAEPIRPGVVKANIASAVNSLPHSLFALLALLAAAALTTAAWEVRRRVRSRGDG
jgi:hypothetical protein